MSESASNPQSPVSAETDQQILAASPFPGGLSRQQIDECRKYWLAHVTAAGGLPFDTLDGMLTAISILPNPAAPERWAPLALGATLYALAGTERETALSWLYRFGAHVGARVRMDPAVHRDESLPEFDFLPAGDEESEEAAEQRSAAAWSAGAALGLGLDPEGVATLSEDEDLRNSLAPFVLLGRAGLSEAMPFTRKQRRQLMRAAAYGAFRLWQYARPIRERGGLRRKSVTAIAEPGRNDPCPCGSGAKYKKCHGATRH